MSHTISWIPSAASLGTAVHAPLLGVERRARVAHTASLGGCSQGIAAATTAPVSHYNWRMLYRDGGSAIRRGKERTRSRSICPAGPEDVYRPFYRRDPGTAIRSAVDVHSDEACNTTRLSIKVVTVAGCLRRLCTASSYWAGMGDLAVRWRFPVRRHLSLAASI
ncbi:hypothetical protein L227DRAFT_125077 [Lentinus tigrinus ALCF2SS1-6]|uniref:Uncharacterized protein n=1 Tax=Lentinus tigrinus ALCF2SS1-6 TaxID=1328759 RepID=A0A5C2SRB2_9APHY|nr:hypothetical protein L227DRAFT_125077 [Lentinus tigrinus ALCF2SS1-6]